MSGTMSGRLRRGESKMMTAAEFIAKYEDVLLPVMKRLAEK